MAAPFIETFTGVRFRPLTPVWANIKIEDIAHALSAQCRFSGHPRHHYSVAEHSVRVAELVQESGAESGIVLWGLLHDASEAYLVDLPTPLKADPRIGREYKRAEKALMRAVCKRFSLAPKEPEIVRTADAIMLATEVRDLMFHKPEHWGRKKLVEDPVPAPYRIRPWARDVAESEFLRLFGQLTKGRS